MAMGRRMVHRDSRGPQIRVNHRIRVPEVRVVLDDGSQLGVMPTSEALKAAEGRGLDLVEVNPKSMPPVCKILDFGKYKYEEKKRASEAKRKQTIVELKEVKLRPKTDDHDLQVKVRSARRFLESGNKVKFTVRFRGREITHPQRAQLLCRPRREDAARAERKYEHAALEVPPVMADIPSMGATRITHEKTPCAFRGGSAGGGISR